MTCGGPHTLWTSSERVHLMAPLLGKALESELAVGALASGSSSLASLWLPEGWALASDRGPAAGQRVNTLGAFCL